MEQIDFSDVLKPGVYLLSRRGRVVFVGRAKCLLSAINAHRSEPVGLPKWFPIRRVVFDQVEVILTDYDQALPLAEALAKHHKCTHNLHAQMTPAPFPTQAKPPPQITRRA